MFWYHLLCKYLGGYSFMLKPRPNFVKQENSFRRTVKIQWVKRRKIPNKTFQRQLEGPSSYIWPKTL